MSDPVAIAAIMAVPSTMGAIGGIIAAWFAYRASEHSLEAKNSAKATAIIAAHTEENTNHMKDELVALTAKASHAEGKLEGSLEAQHPATLSPGEPT